MSAPVPDTVWTSGDTSNPPPAADTAEHGSVATEPLERVGTAKELNPEKVLDPEHVQQKDPEKHAEKHGRSPLDRHQSDWTSSSSSITPDDKSQKSIEGEKQSWSEKINPLKRKIKPPVPTEQGESREYKANFFSHLTFQWMAPIMTVGYQRPLELNDLWKVNPDRSVDVLSARLKAAFKKRVDNGTENPLKWALYDTFKSEFLLGGLCELIAAVVQVLAPFVLRYLINFSTEVWIAEQRGTPRPDIGHGVGLVIGVTVLQIIQSVCTNHFLYRGMTVGGQARAVTIAIIFEKAMKLSGRARAGGKSNTEPVGLPPGIAPGSKEEKKWLKAKLKKEKANSKDKKGVSGSGEGWSNGRIVNLMSTDTYRIDTASGMFHMIWASPISIVLTLVLLLININYSALAGFALLIVAMPLLGRSIKSLFVRRKAINKVTDQRVGLTQEILAGVRFVKYFGWESSFLDRLKEIRRREIGKIQFLLNIRNGIMAVSMSMPVFASMLAFITYSLTDHGLQAGKIFSSLALFNGLRLPLNLLPLVIGQTVDATASIRRIEEFLLAEEALDEAAWDYEGKSAIVMKDANFTWERTPTQETEKKAVGAPGSKEAKAARKADKKADQKADKQAKKDAKKATKALKNAEKDDGLEASDSSTTLAEDSEHPFEIKGLNISIGRDELVAVIGSVGSGKTSILAALGGEMRRTSGEVTFGASRSYCPQYAWIQNATVKENITFGKPFDQDWYDEVVDACALRPDLDMLPNGDLTEIGERGITVSGGQKQRLNIARAIYFNADIVLMDDPLSAVDAHVGRHIMDNAICGLLRNKARVLATHQLHVLHRCDRIIWVQDGTAYKIDTFDNLMATDADFQKMMATTAKEEKKPEEEVDGDEVEEEKKDVEQKTGGKKPAAALMQAEERAVKSVSFGIYKAYVKASGSLAVAPLILLTLILSQGANIATSLWLSWWTSNKFGYTRGTYIGVYAGLGFFDTTPLGRITNRFSKDVDTMDNALTDAFRMFFMTLAQIIAVFILIIAYYYYFAAALGPLFIMFLFAASYYRSSAREIKRHEAVLRSSVFSRFSEAVSGVATIRAYGLQDQFSRSVREAIDNMNSAYYLTFSNQRWLSVRLDAIGTLLVFVTGILVVTASFSVNPSSGGLVLSYILSVVQMIQFTVRQLAEVENNMNSTERIYYYGNNLEEEAPLHTVEVRPSWPEKGEIVFDNVQMRYREGLPLVLKGLNMHVNAGERIGVVGRTGAGKSTIMSTLFRLVELSGGSITVDGLDIAKIGLRDLRSRLSIIPQDPTLFKGTIRSNLDPFNEHTDMALWGALRQADLVGEDQDIADSSTRIHLDAPVEEEGLNFSLGQRQLMALARALVRGSRIIVCDEATSSVDFDTDQKIQRTIVKGFQGKTLLCIAHRLKTIIGYDRICVMDKGQIAELDRPITLYDQGGIFRSMCDRSGIRREDFFASPEANFTE
ncbi:ABC multidrug transporter-like protein [Aureobasidium sp. EXF-12298]|nr:ABC multidrug transporter-like protein [Aureobasidium sp. EXF-12298]